MNILFKIWTVWLFREPVLSPDPWMLLMIPMAELLSPRGHEAKKIKESAISILLKLPINDFFVNQISKN